MARANQVTIGPAVKVLIADQQTVAGGPLVWIQNPTGQPTNVYIGGEGQELPAVTSGTLTSTTGYSLAVGTTIGPIHVSGNEKIYGITNTNTVTVQVFRAHGTAK